MNRHHLILSSFCILLLSTSCAIEPNQHPLSTDTAIQAQSFSQQGQHKEAAHLYQTLAETEPKYNNSYRLLAADALIQSGDSSAAQSHIDLINPGELNAEQRNKLNLLRVQIDLSNGNPEQALERLNNTQPFHLNSADQIIFHQSLAFAYSLTGELFQSVQSRIELDALLQSTEQRQANNTVILDTLGLLPVQALAEQTPSTPYLLKGWMSLAKLLKHEKFSLSPSEFEQALIEWQRLFPQHPAIDGFLQSQSSALQNSYNRPSSIALLLPESGRYAKAASAIKSGFISAYRQAENGFQPSLRYYDSSANNILNLYYQAIAEGAELVIGPLSKDNIQNLALGPELPAPVLALNHIPNLAKNNLFQFGLSPIDENRALTEKAFQDGIENILILVPDNKKGYRTAAYMEQYWQEKGGTVLEIQHYNSRQSDFSQPIKKLLNLNESKSRFRKLSQFLGRNINFNERRRHDVDAIFISASAKKARSLYPQIRFHRATDIPVYASPQVYSGSPNPSADIDLNSIIFCDIPWVFAELYSGELSQQALRDSWLQMPAQYLRLHALGIDAFNIIDHLGAMTESTYPAATGGLALNTENRITRQLACAQFVKGQIVLQSEMQQSETELIEEDYFQDD